MQVRSCLLAIFLPKSTDPFQDEAVIQCKELEPQEAHLTQPRSDHIRGVRIPGPRSVIPCGDHRENRMSASIE